MPRQLKGLVAFWFLALAAAFGKTAQSTPLVLYTDLLSGPNFGGESDHGAYLSIFGKNFGSSSGLGTLTKVFIGGAEVANYRYLGSCKGRPDVQQLTVQLGSLGNPPSGVRLPVEVQVGKLKSKSFTPQTFVVNPGRILFVSVTGDDATAVAGDIRYPWRHVQTSQSASSGAWGAARPGDVIVMRGGLWTDVGFGAAGRSYFVKLYGKTGTVPTGVAGTGPISFTAYPTENVVLLPPVAAVYGVFDGVKSEHFLDANGDPKYSQWITISNLVISTGGINDGPINLESGSNYWRVVNNDLSAPDAVTNRAAGVTGNGRHEAVLGNRIHDIAGTGGRGETLLDHGIYIDSGSDWELAYNLIENISGGNGIQLYNSGHVTPTIDNVNIHHNSIHDVNKHGLNIADSSATGILIWSNVVYGTKGACWRNNSVDLQGAKIWNNTFYNCNTDGGYAAIMNDVKNLKTPITIDFKNNIICPSKASGRYSGGEADFVVDGVRTTGNRNIWFGGNNRENASFDVDAIFANPMFMNVEGNPPDFHLQAASPAVVSGDVTVVPMVSSDYDFEPVPRGASAINRGAYATFKVQSARRKTSRTRVTPTLGSRIDYFSKERN
jgi:hypothetical protein